MEADKSGLERCSGVLVVSMVLICSFRLCFVVYFPLRKPTNFTERHGNAVFLTKEARRMELGLSTADASVA